MARGGLAGGRAPHAGGGRQPRLGRHLFLGLARTALGPLRVWLARQGARPAAPARHPGLSRHGHGLAAALAGAPPSRKPAGDGRRRHALAGRPPGLLPALQRLPQDCGRARHPSCRTLPPPSRPGDLAYQQRVRLPRQRVFLRPVGCRLSRMAAPALRHDRRAQRGLGHGLLEPALRRLGRDQPAAPRAYLCQPDPAARLAALLVRQYPRAVPDGARDPAAHHARRAHDHQLHGLLQTARLPGLGAGAGHHLARLLPGPTRSLGDGRLCGPVRHHPLTGRRPRRGC